MSAIDLLPGYDAASWEKIMNTPKLHLQGIGDCYAVPAIYAKTGDTLLWNYGPDRGPIEGIFHTSPCFFTIETKGSDRARKVKTTRPLAVQSLHQLYIREFRATLRELRLNGRDNGSILGINDAITGYEQLLGQTSPTQREELATLYGQRDAFQTYVRENYTALVLAKEQP